MSRLFHLVVGLGKTGYSIARYLARRDMPFIMFDTRKNPHGIEDFYKEFPGVEVFVEKLPENIYQEISDIIISPGISQHEDFLKKAKNIPVYGDIECLARDVKVPVIAITGTNGKSTVTTLVGEMAKSFGLKAAVAGNIGLPPLDILDIDVAYDVWILELSSFQLEVTNSLKPLSSTVLNITPDHLDRHHTFEDYARIKQKVYSNTQIGVYNRADKSTCPKQVTGQSISFALDEPQKNQWGIRTSSGKKYLAYEDKLVLDINLMRIKGQHNWLNALAACALAQSLKIPEKFMKEVLTRFKGLAHRSQWVRTINNVEWFNDSKGTNTGATISSIEGLGDAIEGKIILIAGGEGKGADFNELHDSVKKYVRSAILIGTDALKIEDAISQASHVIHAPSLKKAVEIAKLQAHPADVVLLSPACASFDMFRDFNHRGDEFIAAVNAL